MTNLDASGTLTGWPCASNFKLGDSNDYTKLLWVAAATMLDIASITTFGLSTYVDETAWKAVGSGNFEY